MARIRVTLLLLAAALGAVAVPQRPTPTASLKLPATVTPGKTIKAQLRISIPAGLHGYANPPTKDFQIPISVRAGSANVKVGKVTYPAGETKTFAGEQTEVYEGDVIIPVELVISGKAAKAKITLRVGYQLCNDNGCFPPGTLNVSQTVNLKRG